MKVSEAVVTPKIILVGVDNTADAQKALYYAIHAAKLDGAKLVIGTVLESDEISAITILDKEKMLDIRADIVDDMARYKQDALNAGLSDVEVVYAEGDAAKTLVNELIPMVKPDLVVIGSETKKGIAKRLGSTAAHIVKHAPISVMVVR